MPQFYISKGIIHQRTCPETLQQNDRTERKYQHLLNVARGSLFQSTLPKHYLCYLVKHAVYLITIIPTSVLANISPYECLFGIAPDLTELKVIGCLAYASTLIAGRHKFDSRSRKCIFSGYKQGVKRFHAT